ncbi:6-phospho-3-hexuloisomerase [Paenibacillus sp. JSM ZJ436]|uniref:6-phospho-3-hexuloisomerase n=1 Tax=Paenibacillus sp. JSM ZJ436 TaxID=3376190 RepID=UPI00379949B6
MMSNSFAQALAISGEISTAVKEINTEEAEKLAERIMQARSVFVAGGGRSGLMMKAFAMRLMQMGYQAYVVGETVTPAIGPEDLLLIGSGSGETQSLCAMANKAKSLDASLALITIQPGSTIGKLADAVLKLPGATKDQAGVTGTTRQPMASLFEQTLLVVLDGMILKLMSMQELSSENMFVQHANLE